MKKLLLSFLILILLLSTFLPGSPVLAAGLTEDTFYSDAHVETDSIDGMILFAGGGAFFWYELRNFAAGNSVVDDNNLLEVKVNANVVAQKFDTLERVVMTFDTSAIPDDVVVMSAQLKLFAKGSNNQFEPLTGWVAKMGLYTASPASNSVLVVGDYSSLGTTVLSDDFQTANDWVINEWYEYEFNEAGLAAININGITGLGLREATKDATGVPPVWVAGSPTWSMFFSSADHAGNEPKLVVQYLVDSAERISDIPANSDAGAGEGGDITGIVWETLRSAYADEQLGFTVSGAVNETIELELRSETGNVVDEHNDVIRDDGDYTWAADVPDSFYGFVRVVEVGSGVTSLWGYVAVSPDNSQTVGHIYARYTKHPPYDYAFSNFMVTQEDLAIVHWKTNLGVGDMTDYSVRFWYEGNSGDVTYNQTMAWLLDNYWGNTNTDNDFMAHWRYILFVFDKQAGFDDRDGMILDLDVSYGWDSRGLYQLVVYKDGESEFTKTMSSYWYLSDQPLVLSLDKTRYDWNKDILVNLDVGETGLRDYWYQVTAELIDSENGFVTSKQVVLSSDSMSIVVPGWMLDDDYEVRVTLDGSISYDYVRDLPLIIGTGGSGDGDYDDGSTTTDEGGFRIWAEDSLDTVGLNNSAGYWLAMLGFMALMFYVFRRSAILRVLMPLLVMGLGLVMGWIDTWIIVLLALGAGVTIWALLRRRIAGGGE
ncbi:hypothetical protein ES703_79669 [subsurface metagenome]